MFECVNGGRRRLIGESSPDQAVLFNRRKRAIFQSRGRGISRMSRDIGTGAGPIGVAPSMVLAPQLCAIVRSDSQSNPTMQTPVLPDVYKTIIGPPDC